MKKKKKKTVFGPPGASRTQWRAMAMLPFNFGFCPDKKAWDYDMKRMGLTPIPYPTGDGACLSLSNCTYFVNDGLKGGAACIVTIGDRKKWTGLGIVSLLAHEATHVFQHIREHIGENKPSSEFEAYTIQFIVEELIEGYVATRGPIPAISQKR